MGSVPQLDGMKEAAQILGASIVTNADGSYSFKR